IGEHMVVAQDVELGRNANAMARRADAAARQDIVHASGDGTRRDSEMRHAVAALRWADAMSQDLGRYQAWFNLDWGIASIDERDPPITLSHSRPHRGHHLRLTRKGDRIAHFD